MRLTQYFLPILKDVTSDAQIISHRLMLKAGLVTQITSGIYSWLPLAQRVLSKIEKIIEEEQNHIGCHRIIMPTIQPASLWQQSGRYDVYGKEMLKIKDRNNRDMLYGPTHEEIITYTAKQYFKSYKDLPQVLYQIHWKFRDEIRPRFGVIRGREFLMKDAYSFDINYESARLTYQKIYNSYLKIFNRMELNAIPVRADSGAIGGDLSHEFHIMASSGESSIYYDCAFDEMETSQRNFNTLNRLYAVADDKYDPMDCSIKKDKIRFSKGIEIGHIFYFGTKYSKAMSFVLPNVHGDFFHPEMGSYGIGLSRIVAAAIESSHDEHGIIWPQPIAPFKVALINAKTNDASLVSIADDLYQKLCLSHIETLYDDRNERPGVKFSNMDLIGLPWQVIVGNKTLSSCVVEVKKRSTGERFELSIDEVINYFAKM